jgi:peptidoglycan/xylan/chitin deacetylase (PgdA/CDA1 family)
MPPPLSTAICRAAYHTGLLAAASRLIEPPARTAADGCFQILTYHRVADDGDAFVPATPVAVFERQVAYLRRHFNLLPLSQLLSAAARREVPARAIAVTFDDGYEDTHLRAYPVLRRYQVPATVFLAAGLIDSEQTMWNDRVGLAVRDTSASVLEGVPGCPALPLSSLDQRRTTLERALQALKRLPPPLREAEVEGIRHELRVAGGAAPRMLSWEQVRELQAGGVEIGAHTVNHPILSAIPAAEQRHEIGESKRMIEERLHAPVTLFAYPNGTRADFDDTTKQRRGGPWETDEAVFACKLWWYRRRRGGGSESKWVGEMDGNG